MNSYRDLYNINGHRIMISWKVETPSKKLTLIPKLLGIFLATQSASAEELRKQDFTFIEKILNIVEITVGIKNQCQEPIKPLFKDPVASCPGVAESAHVTVHCLEVDKNCYPYRSQWQRFSLKKSSGKLIISIPISYQYLGNRRYKSMVLENLEEGRKCAINFYKRFNLILDLSFKEEDNSYSDIKLYDDTPVTNSINWALVRDNGRRMPKYEICNTIIHEMTHHFGLPDTNHDKQCPDRVELPKNNMMTDVMIPTENLTLTQEQIDSITKYLCKGVKCTY